MGFRVAVRVRGESGFNTNALVFATEDEAKAYGKDLAGRWLLVEEWRVEETEDPVTYRLDLATWELFRLPEKVPES